MERAPVRLVLTLALLALVAPGIAAAQADAVDYSEETRQRSLAYFRMHVAQSTAEVLEAEQIDRFENVIRSQVENLGRFETISGLGFSVESPQAFVEALQAYLIENKEEIARMRLEDRGENYNFRFGNTDVTGDAINQVLNSGYVYEIELGELGLEIAQETYTHTFLQLEVPARPGPALAGRMPRPLPPELAVDPVTRNVVFISKRAMTVAQRDAYIRLMGIEPNADPSTLGAPEAAWVQLIAELYDLSQGAAPVERAEQRIGRYYVASFPVSIRFYRIKVVDAQNNVVTPVDRAIQAVPQGQMSVAARGRQQPGMYLLEPDTPEWDEFLEENPQGLGRLRAEAERRDTAGREQAITAAGNDTPGGIGEWVRRIPEFRIRAQVVEVLDGGGTVTQRPGRKEGLRVDDYSMIYSPTTDTTRRVHEGWGIVSSLGPGYVRSGEGASAADSERTRVSVITGQPEVGMMVEEYAMFGFYADLSLGYEALLGHTGTATYAGSTETNTSVEGKTGSFLINLQLGFNVGRTFEFPQLFVGIDGRIGLNGENGNWAFGLLMKKKFFFGAWQFDLGFALGITQFIAGGQDVSDVAIHVLTNVSGNALTRAEAEQAAVGQRLSSPLLFYVAAMPRLQYFFTPHVRAFLQINVQLNSTAAQADLPDVSFDGETHPFLDEFRWESFGLAVLVGASFEF